MESTDCSQLASSTQCSACSCACCCEGGSACTPKGAGYGHMHCRNSSSSSPPLCACSCTNSPHDSGCTCSAACGRGCTHAYADQDEQLKEVNSVFLAAEAALQAFWKASLARVGWKSETAGSEAAYSQVRTAARSQAAASIAWVLAAASVVFKDEADENEDSTDNAAAHSQYMGSTGPHYRYPYSMHRPSSAPGHTYNIIRRPDHVQLSRSTAGSSYSKSNVRPAASTPRWEWRPIRDFNRNNSSYTNTESCTGGPSCAPASSFTSLNKVAASCSSTISTSASAPISQHHPCGVPSITISSLLPPLINCRISNTPFNQEALDTNAKGDPKTRDQPSSNIPYQSLHHDAIALLEPCTNAWSTPPLIVDGNVAIDILDTQVVTKTLVEPFHHVDIEALDEPLHFDKIIDEEEEEKVKVKIEQGSRASTHGCGGEDNTSGYKKCDTSVDDSNNYRKPLVQHDTELSPAINTTIFHGGKNHKKHLKKKQRKASISHA